MTLSTTVSDARHGPSPLAKNAWDYLSGKSQLPAYYQASFDRLAQHWRKRWMLPRSERELNVDWRNWQREQILPMITPPSDG